MQCTQGLKTSLNFSWKITSTLAFSSEKLYTSFREGQKEVQL